MQLANVVDANIALTTASSEATQLAFNIDANERVLFRYQLFYTQTADGDDLQYTIALQDNQTVPVDITPTLAHETYIASDDAAAAPTSQTFNAVNTERTIANSAGVGSVIITGVIQNSGTAGTVKLNLAAATGTATVYAGSFLEYRRF
ncbi:MAG: hypothetical protein EBV86_16120 [Marivivens sp.]|nr:hypothetical protein [Marivivens sp.]